MRSFLLLAALLAPVAARADDPAEAPAVADDEEEDDLFKDNADKKGKNADVPDAGSFRDESDDVDMPTFSSSKTEEDREKDLSAFVDPRQTVGSSSRMPVDALGKDPLADNWAPSVVLTDKDAVVVEIPVLYGRNRAGFDGVAYWIVAETYADGKKVGEQRMQVTRDAIADKGPSVQFFRIFTPVPAAAGMVEVRVGKAASPAAKPTPLFTRSVNYKL